MRIIENWRLDAATASLNDQRLGSIRSCAIPIGRYWRAYRMTR